MPDNTNNRTPKSRLKGWLGLGLGFFIIWVFGFVVGPYVQEHVPTFQKIAKVVEERDIDSAAYFYTEIKASYDGEAYLRQSFQTAAPNDYGFTWPFISGIVLCLTILAIGFRYLPNDTIEPKGSAVRHDS